MSQEIAVGLIRLKARDGEVVDFAIVDPEDWEEVTRYTWHLHSTGYARRSEGNQRIYLHRQLLGLTPGDGLEGDHRNHDQLDNRRSNLRATTHQGNAQNGRAHRDARSQYRGVSPTRSGKWVAAGCGRYLGTYATELEAAEVARSFRASHMPGSQEAEAR